MILADLYRAFASLARETPLARTAWYTRDIGEALISLIKVPKLRRERCGAVIVNYHGVTPKLIDPIVEGNQHVPAALFLDQIRYLKKHYRIVPLRELVDHLELGRPIPVDWVVITFDDGFRNNLTCAQEILKSEGNIPASLFVVTDFIGSDHVFWADLVAMVVMRCQSRTLRIPSRDGSWVFKGTNSRRQRANLRYKLPGELKSAPETLRSDLLTEFLAQFGDGEVDEIRSHFPNFEYLDWDEVRSLADEGLDVGSHTRSHTYMRPDIGLAHMRDEIFGSKRRILEEVGKSPDHFCYPNGGPNDFCELSMFLLQEAGYRCGLTTIGGVVAAGVNQFELKRKIHVGTMPRFKAAVAGGTLLHV